MYTSGQTYRSRGSSAASVEGNRVALLASSIGPDRSDVEALLSAHRRNLLMSPSSSASEDVDRQSMGDGAVKYAPAYGDDFPDDPSRAVAAIYSFLNDAAQRPLRQGIASRERKPVVQGFSEAPQRPSTPHGLVRSSTRRPGSGESSSGILTGRPVHAPPFTDDNYLGDAADAFERTATHRTYGYGIYGLASKLVPAPHEGLPAPLAAEAPGLHDSLSLAGVTAVSMRAKMASTRFMLVQRALASSEGTMRLQIRALESTAFDCLVCITTETERRADVISLERSLRDLMESQLDSLNVSARRIHTVMARIDQEEGKHRSEVLEEEASARQRNAAASVGHALAALAVGPLGVVADEARARRKEYSVFLTERTNLQLNTVRSSESLHRRLIEGIGTAGSLDSETDQYQLHQGRELDAVLQELRFGRTKNTINDDRCTVSELNRRSLKACDAGRIGWDGFRRFVVPRALVLVAEAVLRLAQGEAESRQRELLATTESKARGEIQGMSPIQRLLQGVKPHSVGAVTQQHHVPTETLHNSDIHTLFRLADLEGRGRLTLPSIAALLRLLDPAMDLNLVSMAYNAAVGRRATAWRLTPRETSRLRHFDGLDLSGFEDVLRNLMPASQLPALN